MKKTFVISMILMSVSASAFAGDFCPTDRKAKRVAAPTVATDSTVTPAAGDAKVTTDIPAPGKKK